MKAYHKSQLPPSPISANLFCKQDIFTPYGAVLKDERPTSNIERPTSNKKTEPYPGSTYALPKIISLIRHPFSQSSLAFHHLFFIHDSMLDVRPARNAFGLSSRNITVSRPGDNDYATIVCDAWQAGVGRSSFQVSLPHYIRRKINLSLMPHPPP